MTVSSTNLSRKIALNIFWYYNITHRIWFFAIYSLFYMPFIIIRDESVYLKIFAVVVIFISVVLLLAWLMLRAANKRYMALIETDAQIRNYIADYLYNKISDRRYGYSHVYVDLLIKTGDSRAVDCLAILLKSFWSDTRLYAVKSLAAIGGDNALQLLKDAIDDKNYDVSEEAKSAYSKLTAKLE